MGCGYSSDNPMRASSPKKLGAGYPLLGTPVVSDRNAKLVGYEDISDPTILWAKDNSFYAMELSEEKQEYICANKVRVTFPKWLTVTQQGGNPMKLKVKADEEFSGREQICQISANDERKVNAAGGANLLATLATADPQASAKLSAQISQSVSEGKGQFQYKFTRMFLHLHLDQPFPMVEGQSAYVAEVYLGCTVTGDLTVAGASSTGKSAAAGCAVNGDLSGSAEVGFQYANEQGPSIHIGSCSSSGGPPIENKAMLNKPIFEAVKYLDDWAMNKASRMAEHWKALFVMAQVPPVAKVPQPPPAKVDQEQSLTAKVAQGACLEGAVAQKHSLPILPHREPELEPALDDQDVSFQAAPRTKDTSTDGKNPLIVDHTEQKELPQETLGQKVFGNIQKFWEGYGMPAANVVVVNQQASEVRAATDPFDFDEIVKDVSTEAPPPNSRTSLKGAQGEHMGQAKKGPPPLTPGQLIVQNMKSQQWVKKEIPFLVRFPMKAKHGKSDHKVKFFEADGVPSKMIEPHAPEKVILVVGQTGAGKSTHMDGMLNYLLGVKWHDPFRFKLIADETIDPNAENDESMSQTNWISVYKVPCFIGGLFPHSFLIIDTPGFGDTRGIAQDGKTVKMMKSLFDGSCGLASDIQTLHAISFVTQSSAVRLSASQIYVYNQILAMFGKDLEKNFTLHFTFSDAKAPPALGACKKENIPHEAWYKFNNSALFINPNRESGDEDEGDEGDEMSMMYWNMGIKQHEKFFNHLLKFEGRSLILTREALEEREKIEGFLAAIGPHVKALLGKLNGIKDYCEALSQFAVEIDGAKNFKMNKVTPKIAKRKLPDGVHTTTCLICNRTCHDNCAFADDKDKAKCCMMNSDGNCQACPKKCPWQQHSNVPYVIDYTDEVEVVEAKDMKAKFEQATGQKATAENMLQHEVDEYRKMQHTVQEIIEEMRRSKHRLLQIALRPAPLSCKDHLDTLIQAEEGEAKYGWQKRAAQLKEIRDRLELGKNITEGKSEIDQILQDFHHEKNNRLVQVAKLLAQAAADAKAAAAAAQPTQRQRERPAKHQRQFEMLSATGRREEVGWMESAVNTVRFW